MRRGFGVVVFVVEEVSGAVLLGEGLAFEDGLRVGEAETLGVGGAVAFGDVVAGFAHFGGAGGEVVGVGRQEVDPAVFEEFAGHALGFFAHLAEDGAGSDLDEHAVAHPLGEQGEVTLERGVAFGVGEDGGYAGVLEVVEGFADAGGDAEVGEFDEQVFFVVDGVAGGIGESVLDVVVAEMEVATLAEGEGDGFGCEGGAEFVEL